MPLSREIRRVVGSGYIMPKHPVARLKMESLSWLGYLSTSHLTLPPPMTGLTGLSHGNDWFFRLRVSSICNSYEGKGEKSIKSQGGGCLEFVGWRAEKAGEGHGDGHDWRGKWVWDNWYLKWSPKTQRWESSTSFPRGTWSLVLQLTEHKRCPLFAACLLLSAHHGCNQNWVSDEFL